MSDKIRAAIRVRPFLSHQIKNGYANSRLHIDQNRKQIIVAEQGGKRSFQFDHIFSEKDNQQTVYNGCKVDHMIDKAIEGYHSTIFAYGQTGSGKTHTMQGIDSCQDNQKSELDGLIPKIITNLFKKIAKRHDRTFTVAVSFLQIYNQKIFDLLNPSSLNPKNVQGGNINGLRLRWTKNEQFTVQNLFIYECKNGDELMKFFLMGLKNRINSAHKLNMQSSRSHSILTIRIQSFSNVNSSHVVSSKIQLVDLAGSQRIGMTGTQGKLAKQSIDINKSLFTLRQVISILADLARIKPKEKEKSYVPYRDSKLTSILKQSIGGNSFCLMIACINPNDAFMDENISTLTYATKATYITNQPVINDDPRTKLINQLKSQVKSLNQELKKANQHIQMINSINGRTFGQGLGKKQQSQFSQRLIDQKEEGMPQPTFKKRLTERVMGNTQTFQPSSYDQFSERLVQSINMVRELLKSNKQLRQQLEITNKKLDQKDVEMYELVRQNQLLKQKFQGQPNSQPIQQNRKSFNLRQRNTVYSVPKQSQQANNVNQNLNGSIYGFNTTNSKNNFNYWNSVQINQYYMNERGVDSMPTNFNRRQINSAQDKRIIQSRGYGSADRHAITAKVSKRSWMSKNSQPKKFLSFYNDPNSRGQEVGFY